jgi:hypothetical protein
MLNGGVLQMIPRNCRRKAPTKSAAAIPAGSGLDTSCFIQVAASVLEDDSTPCESWSCEDDSRPRALSLLPTSDGSICSMASAW